MERIGGDRICESALTAASSMMVHPLRKALARGSHAQRVRQEPARAQASSGLPRTFGPKVPIATIARLYFSDGAWKSSVGSAADRKNTGDYDDRDGTAPGGREGGR